MIATIYIRQASERASVYIEACECDTFTRYSSKCTRLASARTAPRIDIDTSFDKKVGHCLIMLNVVPSYAFRF